MKVQKPCKCTVCGNSFGDKRNLEKTLESTQEINHLKAQSVVKYLFLSKTSQIIS